MKNLLFCFLLALTISACQNDRDKTIESLAFTYDTVRVESKNEFTPNGTYISPGKATVEFPVFKSDTINQFIKRQVFNFFAEEEQVSSYQDLAESFVKGYEDHIINSKGVVEQPWSLLITIGVLKKQANYLSLKYTHFDYTGGAHGNTAISFLNYNPTTNHVITLDSLIQGGKMDALLKIAEAVFRKNEKLSATEPLENKYFFDKGKFSLAENFHVTDNGLVFLYNPYEIKPYSEGYTELTIPLSALKGIAKPNTILTTQM
ncbi:MAG: DUF3298 domain-containing protein [Bacteroidia bacterium]